MPTIPLYDTTAPPDAWHRVIAPGGYESWSIAADDRDRETRLRIEFFDGDPFNQTYRRAYDRYVRRPTRVRPPQPRDYPAVRVSLRELDAVAREFAAPLSPGALRWNDQPPTLTIGDSSLTWDAEGRIVVQLAGLLPATDRSGKMRLDGALTFNTSSKQLIGVVREIENNIVRRPIEFNGRGEYSHTFATSPPKVRG